MTTPSSAAKSALSLTSTLTQVDKFTQPLFGIGAWLMRGSECTDAILNAIDRVGYRSVDTARYYRNEADIGEAFRKMKTPREEVYLTTKLFTNDMGGGPKSQRAVDDSLAKLDVSYIDLVLLHAPDGGRDFRLKTWETLSSYVSSGKIRSLGVSNFGPQHIDELMDACSREKGWAKPVVNQIECHPFFAQKEVRTKCKEHGIIVQAYCPLARQQYFSDPTLKRIAAAHGCSAAQVMLGWLIQHDIIPLPKSSSDKRQRENAEALQLRLSEQDMKDLDGLDRGQNGAVESQTYSQQAP